ncbi:hypothetical protein MNBD_GAMMA12-517 [hydrothermal vent metagenome]|uniref:Lipoprotein n=1 Tax=hydrothermal vent metagenome TaxID=652676 RepID=A0A3B0YC06_9ZZZZ
MTYKSVLLQLLLTTLTLTLLSACDKPGNDTPKEKPASPVTTDKPKPIVAAPLVSTNKPPISKSKSKNPRRKISTAILHALSLLDKNEHQAFIKTYMPPKFLKKILTSYTLDKFLEMLKEKGKIKNIYTSLTAAKNVKPVYNKMRNRATIKLKAPAQAISFIKVKRYWYIR